MDLEYRLPFKINLQLFADKDEDDKEDEIEEEEEVIEEEEVKPKKKVTRKKKEAEIDLEAEKIKWQKEYEAKIAQEKINEQHKLEIDKIKNIVNENNKPPVIEEGAKTVPIEVYEATTKQLQDSIQILLDNNAKSEARENQRIFESEIAKIIKDKPYLSKTTDIYLEKGLLTSMADFENLVLSQETILKEAYDLNKKIEKYNGKNPNIDYKEDKRGTVVKQDDRYKNVPESLLKKIDKKIAGKVK